MTVGLQVWDASGVLVFDTGTRMFRKLGQINYGSSNGSAGFSRQPRDTRVVPVALSWYAPNFTIDLSTNTISWDYSAINPAQRYGGTVELWAS